MLAGWLTETRGAVWWLMSASDSVSGVADWDACVLQRRRLRPVTAPTRVASAPAVVARRTATRVVVARPARRTAVTRNQVRPLPRRGAPSVPSPCHRAMPPRARPLLRAAGACRHWCRCVPVPDGTFWCVYLSPSRLEPMYRVHLTCIVP